MENLEKIADTGKKIAAIKRAVSLGRRIQIEFPQLVDEYRKERGYARELVRKHELERLYGSGEKVLIEAIGYAIRGYKGGFDREGYTGLLTAEEADKIGKLHTAEHGKEFVDGLTEEQLSRGRRNRGLATLRNGTGLFGRDEAKRKKDSEKAGIRSFELGVGIHALTYEQRLNNGDKSSKLRGGVLWNSNEYQITEIEYAYALSQMSNFQIRYRTGRILADTSKIAEELNEVYNNNRNAATASLALKKYRKKIAKGKIRYTF